MADRRWRKVARELWHHRARTLMGVLAIAMGLAGAGTILNTWALLRVAIDQGYRASNPASATLWTDSIDSALLARVRTVPGVEDAQARRTTAVTMRVRGLTHRALLFSVENFGDVRIGRLLPESGAWPPEDGTVLIERSAFEFSGAAVGEAAFAGRDGEPARALMVAGIVRDVGLAPGWMERTVYGYVTPATLDLMGLPSALLELQIVTDRRLDRGGVRRIAASVRDTIMATGRTVRNIAVPEPGQHVHAAQMGSLQYTQAAFGTLTLLCAAFLVLNLVTSMLAGQVREIGIMKALGARPGQVAAMYLVFAAAIGAAAAVLALPIAASLGRSYAGLNGQQLNFDVTGYLIPWWVLALQAGIGILVPVAAAAGPVWRACRMSVGEALRDVRVADRPPTVRLTRVHGATRPFLLSIRNAFRRRTRMVLTLTSLSLAGATFIGALNLRHAVQAAVDLLYRPYDYDIVLGVSGAGTPETVEDVLQGTHGVQDAEVWRSARAARDRGEEPPGDVLVIRGVPPTTRRLREELVAGRWLHSGDSTALVVPAPRAERDTAFGLGNTVTLQIDGRASRWTVVGLMAPSGPAQSIYAPRAALASAAPDAATLIAVVAVEIPGTASEVELISRLRRQLPREGWAVAGSQRMDEMRAGTASHLSMVIDFLAIMGWVLVAVGGLGLASTMSLSVLERTREIGVLRAIGARHGIIHALIQLEGLVIALLSWVLAIPLSVPVSAILAAIFGKVFLRVPVVLLPSLPGVGWWLALVVGISMAASAWPAVRATRVSPSAALAYE